METPFPQFNVSQVNKTFRLISRQKLRTPSWETVAYEEWSKFQLLHDQCISIFDKVETTLLIFGLLGNVFALITLISGRHMKTPSFVYHKALVLAYLVYCLNFLTVKWMNVSMTIPSQRRQLNYYSQAAAYYAAILNRVITSACGYLVLYTSLAISIDRFLALVMFNSYARFNRRLVAHLWVAIGLLLSVCLHSWAPWFENEIETTVTKSGQSGNVTIIAYGHRETRHRHRLKPFLVAKDWYNLLVRFAYAILLTALTCVVIYMFSQQQKRRSTLCNVSKRQVKKERSLFYLMIAVVIMAYIQVIPRESKRVLELIYPPEYVAVKIEDPKLSIDSRKAYLLFGLYAYTFTTPILNLCTTIERSLLFYLYFALNHSFRREVLTLLHLVNFWDRIVLKMDGKKSHKLSDEMSSRVGPSGQYKLTSLGTRCLAGQRRTGSDSSSETMDQKRFLLPISPTEATEYRPAQTINDHFSTGLTAGLDGQMEKPHRHCVTEPLARMGHMSLC